MEKLTGTGAAASESDKKKWIHMRRVGVLQFAAPLISGVVAATLGLTLAKVSAPRRCNRCSCLAAVLENRPLVSPPLTTANRLAAVSEHFEDAHHTTRTRSTKELALFRMARVHAYVTSRAPVRCAGGL